MKKFLMLVLSTALFACATQPVQAKTYRSQSAVAHFKKFTACPATGMIQKKCPGYVVDHIVPLCKGGEDSPLNMQFQTKAAGKAKDKYECK